MVTRKWKLTRKETGPYGTPYKVWEKGKDRVSLWGLTDGKINPKKRATKNNIKVVYKVAGKRYATKEGGMRAVKRYMARKK